MKKRFIDSTLIVVAIAVALIGGKSYLDKRKAKPNILIVSACSLRYDRIGVFNPKSKLTPKIDAWAKSGFLFTNGVTERPWQNFSADAADMVKGKYLVKRGYRDYTSRKGGYKYMIPRPKREQDSQLWYWGETDSLRYTPGLDDLKTEITKQDSEPFYLFAHIKYMHYPYYDSVNMSDEDFEKLSPKSRTLLKKYLTDPEKFDVQLPLIELLTNSFEVAKKKLGVKTEIHAVAGIVSDAERNLRWSRSPGFRDDLKLAMELYDLKMQKFDDLTSEVLNLYGDKDLQDHTVVIFMGDHGEAFAEHGVIGHSVNVYDEMLRYPLVVKFPGMKEAHVIDSQITHLQLARLTRGIVNGEVTAENFAASVRSITTDYAISRNCSDTIRAVRYRSEWKFIKNTGSGQNELYDLKSDPSESKNLIDANPDMAWSLEEYMIDHQAEFEHKNRGDLRSKVCAAN